MNRIDRLRATVEFRETDRVPVVPQVFANAAQLTAVPVEEYLQHGQTLAACQLEVQRRYGYDAVFGVMGLTVEAEAAGAALTYRPGQYPEISSPALQRTGDPDGLPEPDPEVDGRMPEVLRAVRHLRDSTGSRSTGDRRNGSDGRVRGELLDID
jgi:uroporphyrinogen decarboxylase